METLFAAFPMLLYIDGTIGGLLLEPLLRFQGDALYTNQFAASDIGALYLTCFRVFLFRSCAPYPLLFPGSSYPVAQGSNESNSQEAVERAYLVVL